MKHTEVEALLPDAACTCALEKRQQEATAEARLYNHVPPKLWHAPACNVTARADLRTVLTKINDMEAKAVLPDPVLERLNGVALAELVAQRDALLHRLTAGTTKPPRRTVAGYSRMTGDTVMADTTNQPKGD